MSIVAMSWGFSIELASLFLSPKTWLPCYLYLLIQMVARKHKDSFWSYVATYRPNRIASLLFKYAKLWSLFIKESTVHSFILKYFEVWRIVGNFWGRQPNEISYLQSRTKSIQNAFEVFLVRKKIFDWHSKSKLHHQSYLMIEVLPSQG